MAKYRITRKSIVFFVSAILMLILAIGFNSKFFNLGQTGQIVLLIAVIIVFIVGGILRRGIKP